MLRKHIENVVNRASTTRSVEKDKSSGQPSVSNEIVENVRDVMEEYRVPTNFNAKIISSIELTFHWQLATKLLHESWNYIRPKSLVYNIYV